MPTTNLFKKALAMSNNKVCVRDLPIYGEPPQAAYEFVEYESCKFENNVSTVRKSVWQYRDQIQDFVDKVTDKYEIGKAHTSQTLHYIQEDSGTLPRAAIITLAGLGGIVGGYRGGVLRKSIYAGTAMLAVSSLCYPHQAVDISQLGWLKTKSQLTALYKNASTGATNTKQVAVKKPAPTLMEPTSDKDQLLTSDTVSKVKVTEEQKDFGMSKAEDKDLYSTRGSS